MLSTPTSPTSTPHALDLAVVGGTLMDPERAIRTVGNVGIRDGQVVAITRECLEAPVIIDATGAVVCPGFIDIHAHVDGHEYSAQTMAMQGITTTIGGNCGLMEQDLDDFFARIDAKGFPLNHGMFVGHSFTLRRLAGVTDNYGPATSEQVREMVRLAEHGLERGALGVSFGLEYAPGTSWEELTALATLAARYDKLVPVHSRYDNWRGVGAVQELVRLAETTGARVLVSHLTYMTGMGMMTEALSVLDAARVRGVDVHADSGLYHAFATFIGSAVFDDGCLDTWGVDYDSLVIPTGEHAGRRLNAELFRRLRRDEPEAACVAFVGKESEVFEAFDRPYMMVSTDGAVGAPSPGTGHPQDAGTFPRFFRTMVREQGRLSLMDAIRRCTILPAQTLGLEGKGTLRVGADADLVIFDPDRVEDRAGYPGLGAPDAPPVGIHHVIVNGVSVVSAGEFQSTARSGRPIRRENRPWIM